MPKDDGLQRCPLCGCTDCDPCFDEATGNGPCAWDESGLCTACADDPIEMIARLNEQREWVEQTLAAAGWRLRTVANAAGIEKDQITRWLRAHGNDLNFHDVDFALGGTPRHVMHVVAVAIALKALSEAHAKGE